MTNNDILTLLVVVKDWCEITMLINVHDLEFFQNFVNVDHLEIVLRVFDVY